MVTCVAHKVIKLQHHCNHFIVDHLFIIHGSYVFRIQPIFFNVEVIGTHIVARKRVGGVFRRQKSELEYRRLL